MLNKTSNQVAVLIVVMCTMALAKADPNDAQTSNQVCNSAAHQQFDFWIGDWQVTNKAGQTQGTNKVQASLNGCVILENWQSAAGNFSGKSVNFYDKALQHWHQTWIDSQGGVLYLNGNLQGQAMVLAGQRPAKDGTVVLHKITYTPAEDGTLVQNWQASEDNGQTWNEVFLGIYKQH